MSAIWSFALLEEGLLLECLKYFQVNQNYTRKSTFCHKKMIYFWFFSPGSLRPELDFHNGISLDHIMFSCCVGRADTIVLHSGLSLQFKHVLSLGCNWPWSYFHVFPFIFFFPFPQGSKFLSSWSIFEALFAESSKRTDTMVEVKHWDPQW